MFTVTVRVISVIIGSKFSRSLGLGVRLLRKEWRLGLGTRQMSGMVIFWRHVSGEEEEMSYTRWAVSCVACWKPTKCSLFAFVRLIKRLLQSASAAPLYCLTSCGDRRRLR